MREHALTNLLRDTDGGCFDEFDKPNKVSSFVRNAQWFREA